MHILYTDAWVVSTMAELAFTTQSRAWRYTQKYGQTYPYRHLNANIRLCIYICYIYHAGVGGLDDDGAVLYYPVQRLKIYMHTHISVQI